MGAGRVVDVCGGGTTMGYCLLPHMGLSLLHLDPPSLFFFNDTATTEIYTLSLHDALPISAQPQDCVEAGSGADIRAAPPVVRSTNRPVVAPIDRKSTRLNSSHTDISRMPSSA